MALDKLDLLKIVDLDEDVADVVRARFVQSVGLIVAKEEMPELDCLRQVTDGIDYIRDVGDEWASRRCLLRSGANCQRKRKQDAASSKDAIDA